MKEGSDRSILLRVGKKVGFIVNSKDFVDGTLISYKENKYSENLGKDYLGNRHRIKEILVNSDATEYKDIILEFYKDKVEDYSHKVIKGKVLKNKDEIIKISDISFLRFLNFGMARIEVCGNKHFIVINQEEFTKLENIIIDGQTF